MYTQAELNKEMKEVMQDLADIAESYAREINANIYRTTFLSQRTTRVLGRCTRVGNNNFTIFINPTLAEVATADRRKNVFNARAYS